MSASERQSVVVRTESIGRGRVEALSDGVFAIVVTLLVLEITVPHVPTASTAALGDALLALAPKFISWVISFVTVCVIWLNHHRLLALVSRIDAGLFWLNANLLLWTSFVPFPTALIGDYPASALAVSFYGAAMCLVALGFVLARWHLHRHPELLHGDVDGHAFRAALRSSLAVGPIAYALGAALAWLSQPAAFVCYAAIAAYFAFQRSARRSP
jgi:uncharacterized membrane protein